MTSEGVFVVPDAMSQTDVTAGSTEQLSPEEGTGRTATEDTGEDTPMETGEGDEGTTGRAEGGSPSPSPAEEPTPPSAEEGKPEGGVKKKSRLRQGLINFKRKLFPRKKGSKLKEDKHGSQKSKSASNVLEEVEQVEQVEQDPAQMERAMSVDSVYPTDQRTAPNHGMKDARSLEALHLSALQSRLKSRRPRDEEESPDTSATDMTQPYGGSSQSLGSENSLENEGMEDFFKSNWTADAKRPVSPEPKIQDLNMVPRGKLLENKGAEHKKGVKPKKTRPSSRHPRTRTASPQQKPTSALPQVIEEPQSMEPMEPVVSPARDKAVVTPSEKKTPDVKVTEKSEAPEEKKRRRLSSEGESTQEPSGPAVVKKDNQKKDDDSPSGGATEFSQMFNKLKQKKSHKKVTAPTGEKENVVLKTASKESNVVTSPTKPPPTEETVARATDKDTPEEVPRPVPAASKESTPEILLTPVREAATEEPPKPKEEPVEGKKNTETPVEPKLKHRDDIRVTQVRRVPSERIGKSVNLRDNNGTPESKVKRRMVSSDGSSLEALHSAQLNSMEWLADRQKKTAETGSKTSLNPTKEEEQSSVKVSRVPSDRKTQEVQLREKSDAPEDKARRRISSDGGAVEKRQSARPTSMQEPFGPAVVKKDDLSPGQKKDDDSPSGVATEFSQMFNKLKQKSQKKVTTPTEEKENVVLKTAPKESNVVTSSKPPLTDTHSNVSKTEEPVKESAVPKQKTVFVINKAEPKGSKLEPPPADETVAQGSSPLLKDRSRRQTLPASPSLARVQSPEKDGDAAKVKRSASQRKQTEPATSTPMSSSAGSGIIRAATVVPKKLPSEEAPSNVPPWAAMARKKTSKFEQNMKLKAGAEEVKTESVKSVDSKPDTVTEPAASVTDTGSTNTSSNVTTKPAVLIIKPAVSSSISSTVSSTTTKPAVSNTTTKPVVSSTTTKPVVSSTTTKPAVSSTTTKPSVLIIAAKPVASSMTAKPAVSNTATKPALSTTKPSGGVMKNQGSTTVFAPSLRSKAPTSNVVDSNKTDDETKKSETILTSDRKENFSGNRKSRVLDMVKNWQNPQVADA